MKILFVADGRSPTAINWMRYFCDRGDEVVLVTTFRCEPDLHLAKKYDLPVAFSSYKSGGANSKNWLLGAGTLKIRTLIKQWLGPISIKKAGATLRSIIVEEKPDIVHAMRIPFEGMVAADAYAGVPLVVSVWGNDFTLHASSNAMMKYYTEWTMQVANALQADCYRDVRLAQQYGLNKTKPTLVVPGSGGVRSEIFFPSENVSNEPLIINPRGFRAYVQNEAFFRAIPLVLQKIPNAKFVCAAMNGEGKVEQWIEEFGIKEAVELLPHCTQAELASVYQKAMIVVSPTTHDGTPNSLIEAMACGCFPIAGDIESIREWITDRENGRLIDATDHTAIAVAIIESINDQQLRAKARGTNLSLIAERAEYTNGMEKASRFYELVMRSTI